MPAAVGRGPVGNGRRRVTRTEYYSRMELLAGEVRDRFGLSPERVTKRDFARIFRAEGVRLDRRRGPFKRLRGAYFNDDLGPTIMVNAALPDDPYIFTLGHELKHHLVDAGSVLAYCDVSNESAMVEIGAEVFAAELLFSESAFRQQLETLGVVPPNCTAEHLVHLKHRTQTTLSYSGLAKRAMRLGLALDGSLPNGGWRRLEDSLYPNPFRRPRVGARGLRLG